MTNEGIAQLLCALIKAYPNFKIDDIRSTALVWRDVLEGYSDEQIAVSLKIYMRGPHAFAPNPGQLIALVPQDTGAEMSELEAWGLVRKAIRNGTYGAEEEFAKLPSTVQAALGSASQLRAWAATDIETIESVAQSNFLKSFRCAREQERQSNVAPDAYKALYTRIPDMPQLSTNEDDGPQWEGVPMPEWARERLKAVYR